MDGIPIPQLKKNSFKQAGKLYCELRKVVSDLNVNEFRKMSPELKSTKYCAVNTEIFLKQTAT